MLRGDSEDVRGSPVERRNARARVKSAVESLLVAGGAARVARALMRRRSVILAYHNVLPDNTPPAGDRSLHLPLRSFVRQLDWLVRTHEVVPLQALAEAGVGKRRRAAITFDDAYLGAVTAGVEELARRGLPATIFVVPGHLGGRAFWWDELSDPTTGGVPEKVRAEVLHSLAGRDDKVRVWAARRGLHVREVPVHCRTAAEEDLRRALRHPGITLASHTWSHPNLVALSPAERERELSEPLQWLAACFPTRWISWLSYPYGLSSGEVEAASARHYRGALRIDGGLATAEDLHRRLCALPRVNVPSDVSLAGFELRVAGLLQR